LKSEELPPKEQIEDSDLIKLSKKFEKQGMFKASFIKESCLIVHSISLAILTVLLY